MAVNAETTAVTKKDSLGRRAPCCCSFRLASVCTASRHTLGLDDDHERPASSAFLRVAIRKQECARHRLVLWGASGVAPADGATPDRPWVLWEPVRESTASPGLPVTGGDLLEQLPHHSDLVVCGPDGIHRLHQRAPMLAGKRVVVHPSASSKHRKRRSRALPAITTCRHWRVGLVFARERRIGQPARRIDIAPELFAPLLVEFLDLGRGHR